MNNKEFQELIDKQPVYALNWLAVVYSKLYEEIGELQERIDETLEYLDNSNMSFVDKNEIAIRLKGSDKE